MPACLSFCDSAPSSLIKMTVIPVFPIPPGMSIRGCPPFGGLSFHPASPAPLRISRITDKSRNLYTRHTIPPPQADVNDSFCIKNARLKPRKASKLKHFHILYDKYYNDIIFPFVYKYKV
jgi:hypothetical protein